VVGIDLGTTNSAVALVRYGHVEVIANSEGIIFSNKINNKIKKL
jgi:molecular chaperone DnaK (HSP70)